MLVIGKVTFKFSDFSAFDEYGGTDHLLHGGIHFFFYFQVLAVKVGHLYIH